MSILVTTLLASLTACTPAQHCTEIAAMPADPLTLQCVADRQRLLAVNANQAAVINDLLTRAKTAEAKLKSREHIVTKPTRICAKGRVLNARNKCVRKRKS